VISAFVIPAKAGTQWRRDSGETPLDKSISTISPSGRRWVPGSL
jgi:hypothetical protein